MRKLRGFTLAELMIVFVSISIVFVVMGAAFGGCGGNTKPP